MLVALASVALVCTDGSLDWDEYLEGNGRVSEMESHLEVEKIRPIAGLEFRREGKVNTRMSAHLSPYLPHVYSTVC